MCKLPNKTQEWREWDHPSVFTVNDLTHIFRVSIFVTATAGN